MHFAGADSLDKRVLFVSTRVNICGIQKVCLLAREAPDPPPSDVGEGAEGKYSFTSTSCGTGGGARARAGLGPVRASATIRGPRCPTTCRCT